MIMLFQYLTKKQFNYIMKSLYEKLNINKDIKLKDDKFIKSAVK